MSNIVLFSNLAAQRQMPSNWPDSPALSVPAGIVAVEGQRKLMVFNRRVIGVFIGPKAAIITRPRMGSTDDIVLLEQVVGFLHAHEVAILRLSLRCPLGWFLKGKPPLVLSHECLVFWVRNFLAEGYRRCGLKLPHNVIVPDAGKRALKAAAEFWEEVRILLHALLDVDTAVFFKVASSVLRLARWWEFQALKLHWRAQLEGKLTPGDLNVFGACDRHWNSCVRLFPSYKPLAGTTCRLL